MAAKYKQILKWVGGKNSSVEKIRLALPESIPLYYEPFFGGGSVFWRNADRIQRAILGDSQSDLMQLYWCVKTDWRRVYDLCVQMPPDKHSFLTIRQWSPTDPFLLAAKWIYINRNCFNGVMRKNRAGEWTATWGQGSANRYPKDFAERLRVCSEQLQKASLFAGDFAQATPQPGPWTVYMDPPYPDDENGAGKSFVGYTGQGFNWAAHVRVRKYASAWARMGAHVLVSNLDTPAVRELYQGQPMVSFPVGRRVAGKSVRDSGKRSTTRANELLIRVVT